MRFILFFISTLFILSACNKFQNNNSENPIAKVHNKYLYPSDLKHLKLNVSSTSDSASIVKSYIDTWIKEQLLVAKAELNLSDEEKNVERQLEKYRTSLLIYKYKDRYIRENLDTLIPYSEIEEYYTTNPQNFYLENTIVKASFIKIPKDLPYQDIYNIRRWQRSDNEEDENLLLNICAQYAEVYEDFDTTWVPFYKIQSELPDKINNPDSYLRYQKNIEKRDSTYIYFLHIDDFRPKSDLSPLEYVEENIRSILLNKRKLALINQLENNVYNNAMNHENVIIY